MTLTFDPRLAVIVAHTRAKYQVNCRKSVGSNARMKQTDEVDTRRTGPMAG